MFVQPNVPSFHAIKHAKLVLTADILHTQLVQSWIHLHVLYKMLGLL